MTSDIDTILIEDNKNLLDEKRNIHLQNQLFSPGKETRHTFVSYYYVFQLQQQKTKINKKEKNVFLEGIRVSKYTLDFVKFLRHFSHTSMSHVSLLGVFF